MRIHVYIDGESHYARSLAFCKKLYGDTSELSDLAPHLNVSGSAAYPSSDRPLLRLETRARFFWDTHYPFVAPYPFNGCGIEGAAYFTAFAGDDVDFHGTCVAIRRQGFDPGVVSERSPLTAQRTNRLRTTGVLEKAKGVDIELSVRVLEDAYHNIYDVCYLFTSDIDFLPVIQAIQRIGKRVIVFGYSDGMANRSELEYVPQGFVNLGEYMEQGYRIERVDPPSAQGESGDAQQSLAGDAPQAARP